MKYIITDKNEVRVGGSFHADMAADCEGRVVRAGHFRKSPLGIVVVWGMSYGYNIIALQEDAEILQRYFAGREATKA